MTTPSRILKAILLAPIWIYQHAISPYTPASCRFTPTCSEYMRQAIIKHGPLHGLWLGIKRLGVVMVVVVVCYLSATVVSASVFASCGDVIFSTKRDMRRERSAVV